MNGGVLAKLLSKASKSGLKGFDEAGLNNLAKKASSNGYNHDANYFVGDSMSNFRDGHVAPRFDDTPVAQRIEDGGDFNLNEVLRGQHTQPDDYFSQVGPRYYGYDNDIGMESLNAINQIRDNPQAMARAYRAVPNDINVNQLTDEDWVTLSRQYADQHGQNRFGDGAYNIIEQDVPADNLWWDGNDINEWGFDTGSGVAEAQRSAEREILEEIWRMVNGG